MPASVSPERVRTTPPAAPEPLDLAGARCIGRRRLAGSSDTPGLDADVLLQHATGQDRAALISRSTEPVGGSAREKYLAMLDRRERGEPVAYIVGTKHFRTIELQVDPRVLVPRPETELLVEAGLIALEMMPGARRVIDVGTGSGAIALSLASELPAGRFDEIRILASDISQESLQVVADNRCNLRLDSRVALVESDLLDGVDSMFDLILANLPYLRDDQRNPSTAYEPESALYAGNDGLDVYRRFAPQAASRLESGGILACEIDPSQGNAMLAIIAEHLNGETAALKDLAGHDRIVIAGSVDIVRTVADTWRYGA